MKKILFINSTTKVCGVYQYGLRTGNVISQSNRHNFIYIEIESILDYYKSLDLYRPDIIIYNNHGPIMPWLTPDVINSNPNIIHVGILHEGNGAFSYGYKYFISQDPTFNDSGNIFSVPRPLLKYDDIIYTQNEITTINSFGFSFGDKGFQRVVQIVCDEFDDAIINLHMPSAHFDRPKSETEKVLNDCANTLSKPNVKLNITRDFLSEKQLIYFLASADINLFPYDDHIGRGVSSVIDYALSVDRPLAITKSVMFRHILNTEPSICIEDRSLTEIISSGTEHLNKYKEIWSNSKLIEKYCYIIDTISNYGR